MALSSHQRVLIVGGVAGGASCAARLRRLSEKTEIIIFERGPFVSFANCGLPYYIGDIIKEENKLLVSSPELFKQRFNIDVRLENNVTAIDRIHRQIEIHDFKNDSRLVEPYDALVLSPGASPIRPSLPGIDSPGIFSLRTIPDSRQIREWITTRKISQAVIIGGGFIGLEMAENLAHRGIAVTVLEKLNQVMPPFDPEMAVLIQEHLAQKGVRVFLNDEVKSFQHTNNGNLLVLSHSGKEHFAEMVILAIGVKPDISLAREAGLELGTRGGIRVNSGMLTSDENIWAVGDAVEVQDYVTQESVLVPLAGPANCQGRIAADNICGRTREFRGVQATSVCGVFGLTAASTGANEKTLRRLGIPFEKSYLHPTQHVGYFPGAKPISMKILFSPVDGRILGAQAIGAEGVERRIDVISMAIQKEGTVFDLEQAELCYAPQYGAAKDPVNFAGMIAANILKGDVPVAYWENVSTISPLIVDVREPDEYSLGHWPDAINLPLPQLRSRLQELPRDREIWLYCGVGQRSYYATRILLQNGFRAHNLSGGFKTRKSWESLFE
jgi:NADPH-dependent 2,4-dienoyl-CoA reductase/sulfur reductase-like enzyme/rhodanese-related sulfurtransferase